MIPFLGLALIRIGGSAGSPEASSLAYLFALVLFLATIYIAIGAAMTTLSLNTMIARGLRGEKGY